MTIISKYLKTWIKVMLIPVALCTGTTACNDDLEIKVPEEPNNAEAGYITISLSNSNLSTRGEEDEPGIDGLNENLIDKVTLCLSPSAGDRTDTDAPAYMQTFEGLNDKDGNVTLRIPLTTELCTRLFNENSSNSCNVFAAVNVDPGEANTVAELRNLAVSSTFATALTQKCFTMDGDDKVTYNPSTNSATGEVKVKRSAAKFTLALAVESSIKETTASGEITWVPNLNGMWVSMQQGVQDSNLDPSPTPNMDADVYFNTANTLNGKYEFEYDENAKGTEAGLKYKYDYVQNIPFYSYPNSWTGNEDERHGTYLLLIVPWSNDGGRSYRTCYYHVPIVPSGTYETVRNMSYHINLHVGVLGSYVPEEPFEVEADYYVANWGEENLDVDIKDYRYLVVDQNEYTVNNENTYSIPFYTSHPTKVISTTMTYYRYNFSDQGSEFAVTIDETQNNNANGEKVFVVDFDNTNKVLNIKHDLVVYTPRRSNGTIVDMTLTANGTRAYWDNPTEIEQMLNTIAYYTLDENPEEEYSAIKFVIKVQHTDVAAGQTSYNPNNDYIEEITVWQYPGMYITAVQNYCDNLSSSPQTWANAILGNTLINNNVGINNNANTTSISKSGSFESTRWPADKREEYLKNAATRRYMYYYKYWNISIGLGYGSSSSNYLNWNPNLYLVTITQLSEDLGSKYIIDDPRSYNINNWLGNNEGNYTVDGGSSNVFKTQYWYFKETIDGDIPVMYDTRRTQENPPFENYPQFDWNNNEYIIRGFETANDINNTRRTLTYYYPTREAMNNKNTIAPKFRICSSYAGTRAILSREMARRRAAAYQEVGYPAGRWRLPTYGEVEYIMKLAADRKIPRLFGRNSGSEWYYWCAQGAVKVPSGDDSESQIELVNNPTGGETQDDRTPFSGNNYLGRSRFVYDEWYWGAGTLTPKPNSSPSSTQLQYDFTWGDAPKTNPENPNSAQQ